MGCATKQTGLRWTSGIIPYVIHPEVTGILAINAAFAFWESSTNVRFVRRFQQGDYLEFILDAGAVGYSYSRIGKIGGRQVLASSQSFDTRTFLHEIGHTLGLIHEQKRSDRDEFVHIHTDNIIDGQADQFTKETDSLNSDIYDFRSVMHYGAFDFAKDNTLPVIEPIDPAIPPAILGSSSVPTAQDITMVNLIYPNSGVIRRSSSQGGAGEVKEIALLVMGSSRVITAVKTGSNKLKMILWSVDTVGGIQRLSPSNDANTAGDASFISIAQAGNNIVAAMRNGSNDLYLIAWQLENGQLVRKGNSGTLAGDATLVNVISLSTSLVLTACRTGSGKLLLILWRVSATGEFTRIADSGSQAAEVSEIALLKMSSTATEHIVVSTVRAGNGAVKVITWAVSATTNAITRRGDSGDQIGGGTQIQTVVDSFGHLIVSCKDGSQNLLLISLSLSLTGREVNRLADTHSMAGEISLNSLVTRAYGVVSGVRDGSGKLLLIKWRVNSTGQFTRIGDSANQAGAIGLISLKSFGRNPEAPLCTAVKDGSGNLLLLSWDDESQAGELQR